TETDCQIAGQSARSRATTVLLPTPDGPDRTVSRAGTGGPRRTRRDSAASMSPAALPHSARVDLASAGSELARRLPRQSAALVRAQAAAAAGLGGAPPFHDPPRPDLAAPRPRLQQRRPLHLAHYFVGPSLLENLGQRGRAVLEFGLYFRTVLASLRRLLKGR